MHTANMWAGYFGLCQPTNPPHPPPTPAAPSNHTPTSLSPSIIPFLLPPTASLHIQLPPCYNCLFATDCVTSPLTLWVSCEYQLKCACKHRMTKLLKVGMLRQGLMLSSHAVICVEILKAVFKKLLLRYDNINGSLPYSEIGSAR